MHHAQMTKSFLKTSLIKLYNNEIKQNFKHCIHYFKKSELQISNKKSSQNYKFKILFLPSKREIGVNWKRSASIWKVISLVSSASS